MKNSSVRPIAASLTLIAAAWLPYPAQCQQRTGAEADWVAITKCAAIKDNQARLACVDDVFRKAGITTKVEAEPVAAPSDKDKSKSSTLANAAARAKGAMPAASTSGAVTSAEPKSRESDSVRSDAVRAEPARGKEEERRQSFGLQLPRFPKASRTNAKGGERQTNDDQLEVTLASVIKGGDGKLVLTTTDGAIWHQVEDIPIHLLPAKGQTMTIAKTALGGFMCKPSRWVSFRCYRTR